MKSVSASAPHQARPSWRLSKTLSRNVTVRPIEVDDLKYAWAAYRKGGLRDVFEIEDMEPSEFRAAFEELVQAVVDATWIVSAPTPKGPIPVGIVLGNWHPVGVLMVVIGIEWFPWASTRNVIEGTVAFFNEARKEMNMIGYVRPDHKKLYEVVLKHGIMRRIGTSHNVFPDEPATVFETRAV